MFLKTDIKYMKALAQYYCYSSTDSLLVIENMVLVLRPPIMVLTGPGLVTSSFGLGFVTSCHGLGLKTSGLVLIL